MKSEPKKAGPSGPPWNGRAGVAWIESQEMLDRLLRPIEDHLVGTVLARPGTAVLDVGCGTGTTTLAAARMVGRGSKIVGIDISEPMIAAARQRAEQVPSPPEFIAANAATYSFEPQSFGTIISRFGLMFFDDPIPAFANLRRAAKEGAELRFFAWRGPEDNPFMITAERAAAPFLADLPRRRADAPGQFGLADRERTCRILEQAGWEAADIRPYDMDCVLLESELESYFTRLGPLGLVLPDVDVATRKQIVEEVRAAFEPFVQGGEVRFTAACWIGRAHAP
ncbi:MAG: class I SAM-dependent methyltransferase [Sphingosinicella sp.]|nr:class I SAM-dependent methyltransferase [Sphingosinicella sp.]